MLIKYRRNSRLQQMWASLVQEVQTSLRAQVRLLLDDPRCKGCITRLYVSRHYISLDVWGSRYNVVSLDLCCWNGRCSIFDDSRNWHFASMASVILSVSPTIGHCMPSRFWYPVFVLCRKIKNNPVSRPHDHSWVMTCICHSTIWLRIIVKWMLRASY